MGIGQNLSADTFGGWANHFLRMERWKDRCLGELKKGYGEESRNVPDFALSYFVWCHSLREWLIEGPIIDSTILNQHLNNYPEWRICRDIANRCRHYDLKRNPTDKHWSMGREYDPFANEQNGRPREKWFLIFGEEKFELYSVINNTFQMWREILDAHNLKPRIQSRFP